MERIGGSWRRNDDPGEPTTGHPRVSVADEETALLAELAEGCHVLEIGTGLGVSTRAMAATAIDVVTVDVDPWVWETIWPDLPDNVICVSDVDVLDGPFGLVFIDGDHTPAGVARDLEVAFRLCPDGVIVAHDAKAPDVAAALDDRWTIVPTEHGIGVRW